MMCVTLLLVGIPVSVLVTYLLGGPMTEEGLLVYGAAELGCLLAGWTLYLYNKSQGW